MTTPLHFLETQRRHSSRVTGRPVCRRRQTRYNLSDEGLYFRTMWLPVRLFRLLRNFKSDLPYDFVMLFEGVISLVGQHFIIYSALFSNERAGV